MGKMAACLLSLIGLTVWLKADIASDLKTFTGAHTRMVWSESTGDGKDAFCKKAIHKLVGLDTDDGQGIRYIRSTLDSYSKPLITPNGDRVVYSSYITGKVHIINWDGSGHKTLVTGFCSDVWADPNTGTEYIYVRTSTTSTSAPMVRYAIDNTSSSTTIWSISKVGSPDYGVWFQVSADGTRAAGTFPWSKGGVAHLPNGSWTQLDGGCWTSMAPDNSYYMWVFNSDHRTVSVYDGSNSKKGELDLHNAPGIYGWEIYHPKWTSSPEFVTMNGPYDAGQGGSCSSHSCGNLILSGGNRMNMYIGKLNSARNSVTGWLRVTNNSVPEFFGDAWIATAPPEPQLNLNKTSLQFAASLGGSAPAAQTVTATGLYDLDLSGINVSESASWLSVGTSGSGTSRTLTNTVSVNSLSAGTNNATVTVTADGESKQYTVSLTITDPSAYHKKINFGSKAVSGWEQGDAFTTGGADYSGSYSVVTAGVTNAAPEALYQSCERDGFDFDMSVPNGEYTVRLHIAEPYWSTLPDAAANRAIDIRLEGVLVEDNLDPAAAAGAVKKAAVIDHTVTVSDGSLTMNVIQDAAGDDAFLMGLEVIGNASTAIDDCRSTISDLRRIDESRLYSLQGSPVHPESAPAGLYLKKDGNRLIKVMIVK